MVSTLILINFGIPQRGHTIKVNCVKLQIVDPEPCSISIFLGKGVGLVSPLYFLYDFSRKIFLVLYSTKGANFIA